ncbi:MAG: phosphotriesterase-related protein [Chloroflexota bacterium]|nr:phosphotriesterase-related protein [Chloroflexota bacterium]
MTTGGLVMTVAGPVSVDALGKTSMHEHLWMDSRPLLAVHGYAGHDRGPWDSRIAAEARWNPGVHLDNYRLTDADLAVEEMAPFVAAGGRTIVELTPPSLGRDPKRVRGIAQRSGVHVVQGTGQYLGPTHEPWVADASEAEITARLVSDADTGIGETGIRAGILGEIGTSDPVRPEEMRILRTVAAAARETGLAISVHLHPWGHEGPAVLRALEAAGAPPERVVLGHLTTAIDRPDELRAMADRGVVLGFDLFGFDHSLLGLGRWPPSDHDVAATIVGLVEDGYGDRIVLGQDVGVRTRLRRWGGWGYGHLLEHVGPLLRELGIADAALEALLVTNPARLLEARPG